MKVKVLAPIVTAEGYAMPGEVVEMTKAQALSAGANVEVIETKEVKVTPAPVVVEAKVIAKAPVKVESKQIIKKPVKKAAKKK
jgi:hypothetical protein